MFAELRNELAINLPLMVSTYPPISLYPALDSNHPSCSISFLRRLDSAHVLADRK